MGTLARCYRAGAQTALALKVLSPASPVRGRDGNQLFLLVSVSPGAQPFLEQIENSAEALQDYGISVAKVNGDEEQDRVFLQGFLRGGQSLCPSTLGTDSSGTSQESRCWQTRASHFITESQNHRMVGVGRDLCGSSSPIFLSKQGHLQ